MEWKERGNVYYGKREYDQAAEAYRAGLQALSSSEEKLSSPLTVALRANLAMVLLKMEQFEMAMEQCTSVLEEDPTNYKALYRRAMAREGMSMNPELSPTSEDQKTRYVQAMEDLQQCLRILDNGEDTSRPSDDSQQRQRRACKTALQRLQNLYNQISEQPQIQQHQDHKTTDLLSTTKKKSTKRQRFNDKDIEQQKKDIMRLLLARHTAKIPRKGGEAFFLMEWKWWCHWCRYVDFFYTNTKNSEQQNSKHQQERIQHVLKLLPPGAVLPDSNDDDDNDSSSEDEEETLINTHQPPGPIDNSRLVFGTNPSIFFQQWYDTTSTPSPLRPNLVRGYHYELLPREAYNALRSWYGETIPSLCRRTNEQGVIILYPSSSQFSTSTMSCRSSPSLKNDTCNACYARGANARCKRCMSVQYCDRGCQEAHWIYHKSVCKALAAAANKESPSNGKIIEASEGRVGLNNLGNTCFMNSALQCLSHATPLTRHFLSNKFSADVNTSNPLGTGGKLAMAYDATLKELWMKRKPTASSPTTLKRAIALFAPRFAGYLQHDSQEFLAYLLDGLHEDLNRIRKAPYVEMPDATDGQNMAIAGAEAWDAHKRRNDSLVMDTFYGQFQSTCVCPKCDRVSVSFDAFNHVSLEIPQLSKMTVTIPVLVFRGGGAAAGVGETNALPMRYGVTLQRQCLAADLKLELAKLTGISSSRLILCDIYENSIYDVLNDKKPLANIRPNDILGAYEVDPYSVSRIHVVATHSLKVIDEDGEEKRPLFGFPFMTSFDVDSTCEQVWEHVWRVVARMVTEKERNDGYVDAENKYQREDILKIRVVNSQGQPVRLFPSLSSTEKGHNLTSILPKTRTDKIRDYLSKDCTENFLLLSLEWENPSTLEDEHILIDPPSFVAYVNHKSLAEAVQKQRARNGVKGVTLDQCFETFTKPERLDEHNMWYCSNCKEHVRALKTMKLWRLPNILVVHLKRFEFKNSLRREKLDTFVDFPIEGLDMNPHCANWKVPGATDGSAFVDAGIPADYDLFAVVNHFGRMGFGHYTAFARRWDESGMSEDWSLFDDSSVRPVDGPASIVTPAAYVLDRKSVV